MSSTIESGAPRLPHYARFKDLRASGICDNWQTLNRLIADYGFPPGQLLSPNTRAWDIDDVRRWLASRPTERKVVPQPRRVKEAVAVSVKSIKPSHCTAVSLLRSTPRSALRAPRSSTLKPPAPSNCRSSTRSSSAPRRARSPPTCASSTRRARRRRPGHPAFLEDREARRSAR
jgi:hypothetical protein